MSVIEIQNITKDYGGHKGVFDVSFDVQKGEVVGFLGPNGSGKTTTIRQLMGFIKPDKGKVTIFEKDCFEKASEVQGSIGYLPGEIAFMNDMNGLEFIEFMAKMKKIKNKEKMQELIRFLELDPKGKIKRMSKGMKQKIGIVIAFMGDADILILDEPTSGLDPLMQNKFVELIQKEKERGKTILMSSHIFEEIEHTCDRVVMIKDGQIIAVEKMDNIRKNRQKYYEIEFENEHEARKFADYYQNVKVDHHRVSFFLKGEVNELLHRLSQVQIVEINARSQSLEELFLHYYGGDNHEWNAF